MIRKERENYVRRNDYGEVHFSIFKIQLPNNNCAAKNNIPRYLCEADKICVATCQSISMSNGFNRSDVRDKFHTVSVFSELG